MSKLDAISMTTQPLLGRRERLLDWRRNNATLFSGSIIMLLGTSVVSVMNFGYNVVVARLLGPAEFGNVSAVVTLFMLVSAITLAYQLVCAKFVARNETPAARSAVYRRLLRGAWMIGVAVAACFTLGSGTVSRYLQLPSAWIVIALACGLAFYPSLGVKRGGLQGACAFSKLSWNFVLESLVRFGGAVALILVVKNDPDVTAFIHQVLGPAAAASAQVIAAVAAVSLGLIAAYFFPRVPRELRSRPGVCVPANAREGAQATVFFIGQVIINNVDILLVKHYFPPREAGLYAAVAIVGRVLYLAAWSIVSTMFPFSAAAATREETGRGSRGVLAFALLSVIAMSVAFVAALQFFAPTVIRLAFGVSFSEAGALLSLRAAATAVYSIAVVLIAYEMSRKLANTSWVQLIFAGLVIVGIAVFHGSLTEVIVVQVALMAVLLVAVSLPFLRKKSSKAADAVQEAA